MEVSDVRLCCGREERGVRRCTSNGRGGRAGRKGGGCAGDSDNIVKYTGLLSVLSLYFLLF